MANFTKFSAAELKEKLVAAGVEVPEGAKKKALVELATANADKFGAGAEDEEKEDGEKEEKEEVALEDVGMADLGFKPTGRYEVVKVGVEDGEGVFRVFGPQGQKVTPLLKGVAKPTDHPNAVELSAEGRASKVAADHNMHVQRAVGRDVYAKFVKAAEAQGFAK